MKRLVSLLLALSLVLALTACGSKADGGQREHEGEREEQRYKPFHGLLFPFKIVLYRYPS